MNILMISALDIWSLGKKSGAQSLYETIKGYTKRGHNVFFLTDKSEKQVDTPIKLKNFYYYFFLLNIDITKLKLHIIKSVLYKLRWLFFQVFVLFYGSWLIKKHKITIIYSYEIFGMPAGMLLKLIFRKPLVARFQGTILKPKLKNLLNLIFYIEHTVAFLMARYSDIVIMTNDGTQGEAVLKFFGVQKNKIRFWLNGLVPLRNIKNINSIKINNKTIVLKNRKIIVTLSRLAVWKRVDRIIKAIPCIAKRIKNVLLIIIGDGEEKENLSKLVHKLKIDKYILFTGAKKHREALSILKTADLFVSLYDLSNVGNPLLEAIKLGKCVLTLNSGDTHKIIKNNYNGILLKYNELDNICRFVVDILRDNKKRKYLGNNALRFSKKNFFSWEERILMEIKDVEKLIK